MIGAFVSGHDDSCQPLALLQFKDSPPNLVLSNQFESCHSAHSTIAVVLARGLPQGCTPQAQGEKIMKMAATMLEDVICGDSWHVRLLGFYGEGIFSEIAVICFIYRYCLYFCLEKSTILHRAKPCWEPLSTTADPPAYGHSGWLLLGRIGLRQGFARRRMFNN